MTIPQTIIDAFAAIAADNPPPDITSRPISRATLSATTAQLAGWRQALELVRQQYQAAEVNVAMLTNQVDSLNKLLGQ